MSMNKKIHTPLIYEPGAEKNAEYLDFANQIISGENLIVSDKIIDKVPFDINKLDWQMQVTKSPNTYLLYLHAQQPVYYLASAYLQTKKKKYLEFADKFIRSWFSYNAPTKNKIPLAWNDHCVSIRTDNIVYYMSVIIRGNINTDIQWLYPEIKRHGKWLSDNKNYYFNHNHGIYEDIALYNLGMFLHDKKYCKRAITRLKVQLKFAYPFKVHIENSMGYNIGMMEQLMLLYNIFKDSEYSDINQIIGNIINNSVEFLACAYRPDLSLPAYGDTLGKLYESKGDIQTWNFPELEYINSKGENGKKPRNTVTLFKEDGFAFARSTYDKYNLDESTWMMFRSGFNGLTHKHKDDLSLCLWSKGKNILIDPGMYNYMPGNVLYDYTNGVFSHSTIYVDGKNYSIGESVCNRAGMLENTVENGCYRFYAYNNLYYGVWIDRSVIYIDENTLIIIDDILSQEVHDYTQNFHFSETVTIQSCQTNEVTAKICDKWNLSVRQLIVSDSVKLISGQNSDNSEISVRSIGMNEVSPTTSVLFQAAGSNYKFVTVLKLYKNKDGDISETAATDDDYLYYQGRSFSLRSRERVKFANIDLKINGNMLAVYNKDKQSEAGIFLLNKKTGEKISDKQLNAANRFTAYFILPLKSDFAVKCVLRKNDQITEEILGFIDWTGNKFTLNKKNPAERRQFVVDHIYSQNDNTYMFKLCTAGFNQIRVAWYVYKNGSSFYSVNGGNEFKYTFSKPGKYCIIFKAVDIYFGEIEKGNFPEIEIT